MVVTGSIRDNYGAYVAVTRYMYIATFHSKRHIDSIMMLSRGPRNCHEIALSLLHVEKFSLFALTGSGA